MKCIATVRLHIVTAGSLLGMCGAGLVVPARAIAYAQERAEVGAGAADGFRCAERTAECAAGVLAKSRQADSDRRRAARSSRQAEGGDFLRRRQGRREGRAGRRHHAFENTGGVLRQGRSGKAGRRQVGTGRDGGTWRRVRRSGGWRRKGNVVVTQKDQTVTGDNGVFDMKTNIATVSGSVVDDPVRQRCSR